MQTFITATAGAYTIHQALWDVPLVQVFWMTVAYAKSQGVEGIMSPSEMKNRIEIGQSREFLEQEAKFLARKKKGK